MCLRYITAIGADQKNNIAVTPPYLDTSGAILLTVCHTIFVGRLVPLVYLDTSVAIIIICASFLQVLNLLKILNKMITC
jgi:hypothetical protein